MKIMKSENTGRIVLVINTFLEDREEHIVGFELKSPSGPYINFFPPLGLEHDWHIKFFKTILGDDKCE
jgi:hypothetical protein